MGDRGFFDQMAAQWDDLRAADKNVIEGLVAMAGLREGDRVLDVGCGTGVLVPFVRQGVGDAGTITAVDFSGNMIARAAEKHKHFGCVSFIAADIMEYKPESCFDKIICFNFFPHVCDKSAFLQKMAGLLAGGGALVIMHDISRSTVNSIHGGCAAVKDDRLPAGAKTAALLAAAGLEVTDVIDDDRLYFVKGIK